jgi:hypothetical protein
VSKGFRLSHLQKKWQGMPKPIFFSVLGSRVCLFCFWAFAFAFTGEGEIPKRE